MRGMRGRRGRRGLLLWLALALWLALPGAQAGALNHSQAALEDLVPSLPGAAPQQLPFNLFSGFLHITFTHKIYYALAESQNNPSQDPLIIWLNAGPGCSGMVGFLAEFGPFSLISPENEHPSEEDMDTLLEINPFSWTRLANILYIEQPIGVGYSHTEDTNLQEDYSDHLSAVHNMLAIEKFFNRFPDLQDQDIYLASESYGGHFSVQLIDEIHAFTVLYANEKRKALYNRIKGVIVGNPFVNFNTGYVARAEALWGMQLVPAFEWKAFRDAGCSDIQTYYEFFASKSSCQALFDRIMTTVGSHIDLYNINFDVCDKQSPADARVYSKGSSHNGVEKSTGTVQFANTLNTVGRRLRQANKALDNQARSSSKKRDFGDNYYYNNDVDDDFDDDTYVMDDDAGIINFDDEEEFETCSYHYMTAYLNRADVKEALHVPTNITWFNCNEDIQSAWPLDDFFGSSFSSYEGIVRRNLLSGNDAVESTEHVIKVLIYSGDNDMITPTIGTQRWMFELPHEPVSLWRPWFFTNKSVAGGVGGYVTQFNSSFTMVTLHEGGHMVAAYQPRQAYDAMKSFLQGDEFFTPPNEVKVLKLYYSLFLREYRSADPRPSAVDTDAEATDEIGSDVGYEFVRDAVRHCLFDNENITISGKLVDVFAVKVHHAYEIDMDVDMGENNENNVGHVPVDDDFLQESMKDLKQDSRQQRVLSPFSFEKDAIDGNNWVGLVYDKREIVVVSVEVVINTFDHLYDLKTELDVAFDTNLLSGHLQKRMRKALHAHHELHDNEGGDDEEHPYSDIMTIVLDLDYCESKEWFSADVVPLSKKQNFNSTQYRLIWGMEDQYGDDDMPTNSYEKEIELLEYSAVNLIIALVTSSATIMLVAGTFISYRKYHDNLMYRLGYEIQDDFDSLLGYDESGNGEDRPGTVSNPLRTGRGSRSDRRATFEIEDEDDETLRL